MDGNMGRLIKKGKYLPNPSDPLPITVPRIADVLQRISGMEMSQNATEGRPGTFPKFCLFSGGG